MDATSVRVDGRPTVDDHLRAGQSLAVARLDSIGQPSALPTSLNLDTVTPTDVGAGLTTSNDQLQLQPTPSYSTNRRYSAVPSCCRIRHVLSPHAPVPWAFAAEPSALAAGSAAYDQSSQFVVDSFSWLRGEHQMKLGVHSRIYPRADRSAYGRRSRLLTTASWVMAPCQHDERLSPKDSTHYNLGVRTGCVAHDTSLTLTYGCVGTSIQAPSPTGCCL
jgi:hypothetical protein